MEVIEGKPEPAVEYKKLESPGRIASIIQAQAELNNDLPCCYICMDSRTGEENSPDELIAPCSCYTYVHRKCLDHWRTTSFTYNCMTQCPTCRSNYMFDSIQSVDTADLKKQLFRARWWRAFIVLLVVLVGSVLIAIMDEGLPDFFHLDWNALDGKIYNWIGLTQVPRFIIYFILSLAMTAFITCVVFCIRWCWHERVCQVGCYACVNNLNYVDCAICVNSIDLCCETNSCDFNDEADVIVIVVVAAVVVAFGLVILFVAVIGGVGSVVDRQGERRI
ncbi:hypothetical protein AC1031_014999 [Aphanomyces cochlioides]|nr:hypothetical protein AC1031_014999 [Aphanomyces cochlioides]